MRQRIGTPPFDGLFRPEPWRGRWAAVMYRNDGHHGVREQDSALFRDEEGAQARSDDLNGFRMADREAQGRQKALI